MLTLETMLQQGAENYDTLAQNIGLAMMIGRINSSKLPTMRIMCSSENGPKVGIYFSRENRYSFTLFEFDNVTLAVAIRSGINEEIIRAWGDEAELVDSDCKEKVYRLVHGNSARYVSTLSDIMEWCCEN